MQSLKHSFAIESYSVAYVLVAVAYVFVYFPLSRHLGFAGDDWNHVFGLMGPEGFLANLSRSVDYFLLLNRPTPLQSLSLATLHAYFDDEPGGYFVFAFSAKAISGLLISIFVYQVSSSRLAALAAAVFWLVAPISSQGLFHITAGAGKWQGSIYLILSMMFYLVSLTAERGKAVWIILGAITFVLALLSYEQAITFLLVYPLIHWLWASVPPLKRIFAGWFWIFVILGGIYAAIRVLLYDGLNTEGYHVQIISLADFFSVFTNIFDNPKLIVVFGYLKNVTDSFAVSDDMLSWPGLIMAFVSAAAAVPIVLDVLKEDKNIKYIKRGYYLYNSHIKLIIFGFIIFSSSIFIFFLLSTWPSERNMIFPTIGLAICVGGAVGILQTRAQMIGQPKIRSAVHLFLALIVSFSALAMTSKTLLRAEPYTDAGRITRLVYKGLKDTAHTISNKKQVVLLGTPWIASTDEGGTWVFTANYAVSGAVSRALELKPDYGRRYGVMGFVPTERGYYENLEIRSPGWTGYTHNYYTRADQFRFGDSYSHIPARSYSSLALLIFDGKRLRRVNSLLYQTEDGRWHAQKLAEVKDGITFRFPRVAKLIRSSKPMPGKFSLNLKAGPLTVKSYMIRSSALFDTANVQIDWERKGIFLDDSKWIFSARGLTADDSVLFEHRSELSKAQVSRQLERVDWGEGQTLRQDFLFSGISRGGPFGDIIGPLDHIKFSLFGPDSKGITVNRTASMNVRYVLKPSVNSAPKIIPGKAGVVGGRSVLASSLFSVHDAELDVITKYVITYYGPGGGHLSINGVRQKLGKYIHVDAEKLSTIRYVAGKSGTSNGFWVRAYDGKEWGEWKGWNVMANSN